MSDAETPDVSAPSSMPATTVVTGATCIALGVGLSVAAHAHGAHWATAAIPAYVGVVFVALGLASTTPARRKHLMHAAAALALLLGLASLGMGVPKIVKYYGGTWPTGSPARPLAWWGQVALAAILLTFVGLAVRSFVAARRWRLAQR